MINRKNESFRMILRAQNFKINFDQSEASIYFWAEETLERPVHQNSTHKQKKTRILLQWIGKMRRSMVKIKYYILFASFLQMYVCRYCWLSPRVVFRILSSVCSNQKSVTLPLINLFLQGITFQIQIPEKIFWLGQFLVCI